MEQEVERYLQQIDVYIETSQDANFDRYLEQMKLLLQSEPQRLEEIQQAVERNMQRYYENINKRRASSMESKVGIGVLSGIGSLFVLVALILLLRNFVPRDMQGMLLIAFFALLWLIAQLALDRVLPKLARGISAGCILGLYLAAVLNYHTFEFMPVEWAIGIQVLVALISWCVGFVSQSAVIQCMSFGGYFFFSLFLPWPENIPAYFISLAVLVGLNLMWHFGAAGRDKERTRWIHGLCFVVLVGIYHLRFLFFAPDGWSLFVLLHGVIVAALLNLFHCRTERADMFWTWIGGAVYQTLLLLIEAIAILALDDQIRPLILLVLVAVNLAMLFWRNFRGRWQGLYYQALALTLLLAISGLKWPGILAGIVLVGCGLWRIKERKLMQEIVTTVYGFILLLSVVPEEVLSLSLLAFLLAYTVLCLYVPRFRTQKEAALVYTNISLMGITLLSAILEIRPEGLGWLVDTGLLILAVTAVLVLWRDRCHLPGRIQGVMLAIVLTYMIFVYRLSLPIMVSILMMVVAIGAIVAGFARFGRILRIYGLCLALAVCVKVVFFDYWDLELFPKSILLLAVGILAIAISVIYAVLEHSRKGSEFKGFRETERTAAQAEVGIKNREEIAMNIGVNFFGPKRKLYQDFNGTLERLKEGGITFAEICVAFAGDMEPPKELELNIPPEIFKEMSGGIWHLSEAEEKLAAVRAGGLSVISVHMMLGSSPEPEQLVEMLPVLLEFGKKNQIRYFVLSLMKGLTEMKRYAGALHQVSRTMQDNGIQFVYHNHETECMVEEGTTALDYILEQCPDLKLELDVGWAKFAGADPVELMRKYRDRLVLLHFKDIRADASPETRDTCFTAVGEGSIPLREIMAEAKNCPLAEYGLIIDQDDSPADILEDLAAGVRNIQAAAQ